MTTVCLVVHAEGPGDLGSPSYEIAPRESLMPEELGPAHILIQRILSEELQIPAKAIDFLEPLRTNDNNRPYGSKLLNARVLDEILIGWSIRPSDQPLVVLLVDSDEQPPKTRCQILEDALSRNLLEGAVGVAVKEFETWLVADTQAVAQVVGMAQPNVTRPENLECGEAKTLLNQWIRPAVNPARQPLDIRRELVVSMDLSVVAEVCPSFREFQQQLVAMGI